MAQARDQVENQPMLSVSRLVKEQQAKGRTRYAGRRRIGRGTAVVVDIRLQFDPERGTGQMSTKMESAKGWRTHNLRYRAGAWMALCPHWVDGSPCVSWCRKLYWPMRWASTEKAQMNFPAHCRSCCMLYTQTQHRPGEVTDMAADIRAYKAGVGTLDAVAAALQSGTTLAIHARLAMEYEGLAPRMLTRDKRTINV